MAVAAKGCSAAGLQSNRREDTELKAGFIFNQSVAGGTLGFGITGTTPKSCCFSMTGFKIGLFSCSRLFGEK